MNNWIGLLKKEFRLTRTFFFGILTFDLLIMVGFMIASANWETPYVTSVVGAILIGMHSLFLPFYLLTSLNTESRNIHLWLHNPHPGYKLLAAKMLNGFVAMLMSVSVVGIFALIPYFQENTAINLAIDHIWLFGFYFLMIVSAATISTGIWITFYWMFYQVIRTYIGKWALVLVFGLIGIMSWFGAWFSETVIAKTLTEWGAINLPSPINMSVSQQQFDLTLSTFPFYVGNIVFDFIILVIIFLVSCWLLDRKVEV